MNRVPSNCYPEPLQSAKVWSNLFFQRKKATRNNSVFPGLGKNTTRAPQLHFLDKYANCLKMPKKIQNSSYDGWPKVCAQRIQHELHRNWEEVGLALAHAQSRLGILDLRQPNLIIFLGRKSYLSERCVGKTPQEVVPCLSVPSGHSPASTVLLACATTPWDRTKLPGQKPHLLARNFMLSAVSPSTPRVSHRQWWWLKRKTNIGVHQIMSHTPGRKGILTAGSSLVWNS